MALHSSLREDGFPSPHETEPGGLQHAFSGPMDTAFRGGRGNLGTSMQDSSIPTTCCHEALHTSPVCSGLTSLSSNVAGEDNGQAPRTQIHPAQAHSALQRAAGSAVLGDVNSTQPCPHQEGPGPAFHWKFSTPSTESWALLPDTGINCKKMPCPVFGKVGSQYTSTPFLEKTELRVRIATGFNRGKPV